MLEPRSFWRDRPTLVTGGTGLVGGWTVELLLQLGADVVCLVRDHVPQSILMNEQTLRRIKLAHGDLCDLPLMERVLGEYEINTVLHLAAQTIVGVANRSPLSTFETNIRGTYQLLEACRRSPSVQAILLASSDKAYGSQEIQPYNETMPLEGRAPYDVSKSCADLLAQAYSTTYRSPLAITRCGNFYGGGDLNWSRIVPGTIRSVLRGDRPIIRSDGDFIRDYFYVEDGAAAYIHLAQRLHENPARFAGEAYNFSTEEPVTVLEITRRILSLMGSNLEPDIRNEANNEIRIQHLDATKARTQLGWKPLFSVAEGLRATVAWYEDFFRRTGE